MPIAHLPGIPTLGSHSPLVDIIMDYSNLTFSDVRNILQQQQQTLHQLSAVQAQQADQIEDLTKAIDSSWTLNSAYLVFIMQLGFALLEAGSVRAMNTKNILMQNIMDTGISIIAFWLVGYGIATTDGTGNMGIGDMAYAAVSKHVQYPTFIFLWSFNNCATTIVSGAVTSRIKFSAYMASAIMVSGFIFPVVAYWTWGYGFLGILNPNGWKVIDFAGGLVVHVVGGCTGLMGILVLGPRESRFAKDEHGKPVPKEPGHSIVLATIGMFLLWFGWFGFNSGSTQGMSGGRHLVAGQAAVNSLLAAGASMITMCIWSIVEDKVHDSWELLNGILCGLVAVTPAVATVEPWAAIVIGIISVAVYRGMTRVLIRFEVDDVVDAFSLHGMNGAWGCIATALFSTQGNCDLAFGPGHINFRVGYQLGIHLAALIIVATFTCVVSGLMFWIMHKTVGIRVSLADERVGLDFKYHAGYAYPDFNVRVKRAKEQMQLEAEIGNAVRREMAAGRGARFKEAAAVGSSHAIPVPSNNNKGDDHELSLMASRRSSNKMGSGGSVVAVAPTKTTELSGARSTGLASSGSTHGNGNNSTGAVMGPAGGQHFIPMRKSSVPSVVSPTESHSSRWATSSPHMSNVADELPTAHTQQNPAHKRSSTRMNIAVDSTPVQSEHLASSYAIINNPNSPSS